MLDPPAGADSIAQAGVAVEVSIAHTRVVHGLFLRKGLGVSVLLYVKSDAVACVKMLSLDMPKQSCAGSFTCAICESDFALHAKPNLDC